MIAVRRRPGANVGELPQVASQAVDGEQLAVIRRVAAERVRRCEEDHALGMAAGRCPSGVGVGGAQQVFESVPWTNPERYLVRDRDGVSLDQPVGRP